MIGEPLFDEGSIAGRVAEIGDLWKPLLQNRGRFDLGRLMGKDARDAL